MSTYFPDGRPIQRMMHALSSDAEIVAISPTDLTGNVIQAFKADFVTNPTDYPGYTADSFNEVLNKSNIMYIAADGGYFNLSNNLNKVYPPAGGMYIHGAETIRKVNVSACQVILYIKPTP
jgi:hypothetical protein